MSKEPGRAQRAACCALRRARRKRSISFGAAFSCLAVAAFPATAWAQSAAEAGFRFATLAAPGPAPEAAAECTATDAASGASLDCALLPDLTDDRSTPLANIAVPNRPSDPGQGPETNPPTRTPPDTASLSEFGTIGLASLYGDRDYAIGTVANASPSISLEFGGLPAHQRLRFEVERTDGQSFFGILPDDDPVALGVNDPGLRSAGPTTTTTLSTGDWSVSARIGAVPDPLAELIGGGDDPLLHHGSPNRLSANSDEGIRSQLREISSVDTADFYFSSGAIDNADGFYVLQPGRITIDGEYSYFNTASSVPVGYALQYGSLTSDPAKEFHADNFVFAEVRNFQQYDEIVDVGRLAGIVSDVSEGIASAISPMLAQSIIDKIDAGLSRDEAIAVAFEDNSERGIAAAQFEVQRVPIELELYPALPEDLYWEVVSQIDLDPALTTLAQIEAEIVANLSTGFDPLAGVSYDRLFGLFTSPLGERPGPRPSDLRYDGEYTAEIPLRNTGLLADIANVRFRGTWWADPVAGSRTLFANGNLDAMISPYFTSDFDGAPSTLVASAEELRVDRFNLLSAISRYASDPVEFDSRMDADPIMGVAVDAAGRDLPTRAFLRAESWTGLGTGSELELSELTDRGVWIVHPAAAPVDIDAIDTIGDLEAWVTNQTGRTLDTLDTPIVLGQGADSPVLHADFAIATGPDGLAFTSGGQPSTISATIGKVDYRLLLEGDAPVIDPDFSGERAFANLSVDAFVRARTVGTSRDAGGGSTLYTSDFLSSAAGGGNPNLGDPKTDGIGKLGFFVVENAGEIFEHADLERKERLPGGRESPMGSGAPDLAYGATRLAVATAESFVPVRRDGFPGGLRGYATGISEVETVGSDTLRLGFATDLDTGPALLLNPADRAGNLLSGTFRLGGREISLGGAGASAYVDDLTWGLLDSGGVSTLAIISGETVGRELVGQFRNSTGKQVPIPISDPAVAGRNPGGKAYKHVQWGFFFGDVITREGSREHVHMGTFAAARPVPRDVLDRATGRATYRGHAIGNVYNGGDVYTSVGTFSDSFDFDTRKGNARMDFDRRAFAGGSQLDKGRYRAGLKGGDRTADLRGQFGGAVDSKNRPQALVGQFSITNASNNRKSAYRATGTFGAER